MPPACNKPAMSASLRRLLRPTATVLVRVDHAARKGGNVSLRAWPALAAGETNTWTQTAGPQVTLDVSDPNRVLFVAPEVTRDTALTFRVTRRTAGGATDTDDVFVLIENYAQAPSDPSGSLPFVFSDLHVSRTYPYRAGGPFAGVLVRCTYEANLQYTGGSTNLCPLSTLPFLHQTTAGAVPTVDQIMDRVVVSHDWMGETFEQLLRTQASQDMLRLFNGVTAIVIGAQVRPSFYYALTGAIYLDADNFWLTAAQRDVINEAPDFRSDFDRDLMYSGVWRYTQNNQNIFLPFPATSRISRDISYLLAEAGWLLYHELAHASDFLPPSVRASLNSSLSAWGNHFAALSGGAAAVGPDVDKFSAAIDPTGGPGAGEILRCQCRCDAARVYAERCSQFLRGRSRDRRIQLLDHA